MPHPLSSDPQLAEQLDLSPVPCDTCGLHPCLRCEGCGCSGGCSCAFPAA